MSEALNKSVPMTVRVDPTTPDRLAQLSLVLKQPIGKLIDGMVMKNFNHAKRSGQIAKYLAAMESEEREIDET